MRTMNKRVICAALIAGFILVILGLAVGQGHARPPSTRRAVLRDAAGEVVGFVRFTRTLRGKVAVRVTILLATEGFHGIHVHANADGLGCVPPAFTSVGPHFVLPGDGTHGAHAGDMPNVLISEDGTGELAFITDEFALEDITNRAVILHADRDNHGHVPVGAGPNDYTPNSPGAVALTESTGNAGARIACGVIE